MRNYKRKSDRGKVLFDVINSAARQVIDENRKIRSVAKDLGICHVTLCRFVKKLKTKVVPSCGYVGTRQVVTYSACDLSCSDVKTASAIYFGLNPRDVRKLAYECAIANGMNIPESWKTKQMAGEDWLSGFLKRIVIW